jgi:hypothetical protein
MKPVPVGTIKAGNYVIEWCDWDKKSKQREAHSAMLKKFLTDRIKHHKEAIRLDELHLELLK